MSLPGPLHSDLTGLVGSSRAESTPASEFRHPIAPALAARSVVKRAMDLAGSIGGLILLSPVLALVGLLVRLESRGPILFRQPRRGQDGRVFVCLKFRTMVPDAEKCLRDLESRNESAGGILFKIKDDPRVTPIGRYLRRTGLDELPQLWNVLMGEMSLVGPRPLPLRDSERLGVTDPESYARRLSVLPGITGPSQVAGRSDLDVDRMMRLDLDYVANWSLECDLFILVRTAVLLGRDLLLLDLPSYHKYEQYSVKEQDNRAIAAPRSSVGVEQSDLLADFVRSGRHMAYVDAGTFSYVAGLVGAAAFMALSIGPGILGFLVVYLPVSGLSVWAASSHD